MDKETIHARYKDLALVEKAFRTCKTRHLEIRPIFVLNELRTRGHAFVVMLAYRLVRYLENAWKNQNITAKEGLELLTTIYTMEVRVRGKAIFHCIPQPSELHCNLLNSTRTKLPTSLKSNGIEVTTRKALKNHQISDPMSV